MGELSLEPKSRGVVRKKDGDNENCYQGGGILPEEHAWSHDRSRTGN